MQSLQAAFLNLVEEETNELIADAERRLKGANKVMKFETLDKAQGAFDALLAKNAAILKALHKAKGMVTAHHGASVDMHKGFHSDIHASKDHAAAKEAATGHLGKAMTHHGDHMSAMHAHLDKTIASMTGGDTSGSAGPGSVADASPASVGEGGAHSLKAALTQDDLESALMKQQEDMLDVFADLMKTLSPSSQIPGVESTNDVTKIASSSGIGDRTNLEKLNVHQGGPAIVVTKDGDNRGAEGNAASEVPTPDDVRKAQYGDQAAQVKIARYALKGRSAPPQSVLQRVGG
jgi:hypothetical protein